MLKFKNLQTTQTQQNAIENIPSIDHYVDIDANQLKMIESIAAEIQEKATALLVIGVGGSFLGARAVIDAVNPYYNDKMDILYAGNNMSGAYMKQLLAHLDTKELYVNVISKSGSTMEPALAYRIVREYMSARYGESFHKRIIVTTDAEQGILKQIAIQEGYRQLIVPRTVGGRYSVFTPVGLLPIAVAGINIHAFRNGAMQALIDFDSSNTESNAAYQYALARYEMYKQGFKVELLASFEPRLNKLHEWWKQLFGESEGKEYKGLYPSTVNYSTDLHAIGQFIQEGSRIMFETLIHFEEIADDIVIPFCPQNIDGLNYLADRSLNDINRISKDGVALAHEQGDVQVMQITLPKLDAYHVGYLMMFFMKACVISSTLLHVNPFDQPGVEAYKSKMIELLKQPIIVK